MNSLALPAGTPTLEWLGLTLLHFAWQGVAIGAAAGWHLAGRRAAWITGLAGLVFALGPGHNIPLLGGTAGAAKGAVLLASIVVVSTFVLVETHARLARPRARNQ